MACPPPNKCFQVLTNDELKAKMEDLEENQNSVNSEKRADKAFRQFLSESGSKSVEYHLFEEELDNWLYKFWFGARTANNELYILLTVLNHSSMD